MKRSPELEALALADEAGVRDPNAKRRQMLGVTALLFGGAVAAYLVLNSGPAPRKDILDGDEEFQTTTFRPPSFPRQEPKPPVKPPVVKPADIIVPANLPPPPPVVEVFPERYRSAMVVLDEAAGQGDGAPSAVGAAVAGNDRSSKFLAAASSLGDRSAQARQLDRIDALIPEGTMISGILETAVNSDLPGQVRAIVSEDVYSFDGRRVLIPTGSRLIGEYQSGITRGQKRVFLAWTRLIRDDGVSIRLNSIGADQLGRSGMTGHVDNKLRERFTSAIMLSMLGGGVSYLAGSAMSALPGGAADGANPVNVARSGLAASLSEIAEAEFKKNLSIPPTISVPQGERILVYVRQDLDFSALYPDPVTEAMEVITHERGLR